MALHWVKGIGFRCSCLGFRGHGSGFRDLGLGSRGSACLDEALQRVNQHVDPIRVKPLEAGREGGFRSTIKGLGFRVLGLRVRVEG